MYQISKNKVNNNQFKYYFKKADDGKELTYREFINLLKSKDHEFLKIFREALNNAAAELSAYF